MFYRLDRHDLIVEVDLAWDEFALSNGGSPRSLRDSVIGAPLIHFVAGDAARMFVRSAMAAARDLGQVRELPYRCDSPTERRLYKMQVRPLEGGMVQVDHLPVSSAPRLSSPVRAHAFRAIRPRWRCSQCLRVRRAGSNLWTEADPSEFSPLAADVCPTCSARLFDLTTGPDGAVHG